MKFFIAITLIFISLPVLACDKIINFESLKAQSDVIFFGKPILIGKRYTPDMPSKDIAVLSNMFFNSYYEVTFEVEQIWKGAQGKNIYLLDNDGECSYKLAKKIEQNMLIFAKFDKEGLKILSTDSSFLNQLETPN